MWCAQFNQKSVYIEVIAEQKANPFRHILEAKVCILHASKGTSLKMLHLCASFWIGFGSVLHDI